MRRCIKGNITNIFLTILYLILHNGSQVAKVKSRKEIVFGKMIGTHNSAETGRPGVYSLELYSPQNRNLQFKSKNWLTVKLAEHYMEFF